MITDDVLFSSLRSMGHAIRTRKLSPVELTGTYLNRLETIGPGTVRTGWSVACSQLQIQGDQRDAAALG